MALKYSTEDLRILNVASQCIFYFAAYRTSVYEQFIENSDTGTTAELLEQFYHILTKKGKEYDSLTKYLDNEAHGNYFPLGAESMGSITKAQYAGILSVQIMSLDSPASRTRYIKSCGYPEDF